MSSPLKTVKPSLTFFTIQYNKFHSDYSFNYSEIAPAQRPVSVILALNQFDFMYLPHISQKRRDIVHLTVPAGHAIIFTDACLHSGDANNSKKHLYQLFPYMVSSADQIPANKVYKYVWKGADDDLDTTILYFDVKDGVEYDEKGGGEGGDDASDDNMDGDTDDGGGKQMSNSGM